MHGAFYFDNHSSEDLGIYIVDINGEDDSMPLFGGQSYTSQEVIGHDYETFIRTKKENLKLTMYFALCEKDGREAFTTNKLYTIGKFFSRSIPFELKVAENMLKVIKVVPTSGIELIRFGQMKGYFQITFQATTPYWLTPMDVQTFTLTTTPIMNNAFSIFNGRNIQDKYGNYDIYPKVEINIGTKSSSNFILNINGSNITFNNFVENDSIVMYHKMVTSQLNPNGIFQSWNKKTFSLTEGNNTLTVNNNCVINVYLQYPIFY